MDSTSIPTPITQLTPITPIFNKINEIYIKTTYLEKYGGSLIFTIFAIIVVLLYFTYLNIQNNKDWATNKCSPLYMPFAGSIMEPKDMSNMEFTIQNFSQCSETILKDIIQIALAPLQAIFILLSAFISILTGIATSLMGAIAGFRSTAVKEQTSSALEKQTMFSSILTKVIAKARSALRKGEGILSTLFFVFFSAYKAASSVFYVILLGESIILILMFIGVFISWGIYLLFMIFFFTIPVAGAYLWVPIGLTVIYVAFMIMIIVLIVFTASVIAKTK
jgi:hypothetical protein